MNRLQRYLHWLFGRFGSAYALLLTQWLRTGHEPLPHHWLGLAGGLEEILQWADLSAHADLWGRATGRPIVVPPSARQATQPPRVQQFLGANPTYAQHAAITHPVAAWRAAEWAKAEQAYAEKLMARREALAKNQELTDELLAYRLRRVKRDQVAQIAQVSEQVTLAVPEIGRMFPYGVYRSREDWRVRPTHAAMHGFVAVRDWEGWRYALPGTGWNCRCTCRWIALHEARRAGWLDANDHPKFILKWPSPAAEANWNRGLPYHGVGDYYAIPKPLRSPVTVFPDPGIWMLPRSTSFDLSRAPAGQAA